MKKLILLVVFGSVLVSGCVGQSPVVPEPEPKKELQGLQVDGMVYNEQVLKLIVSERQEYTLDNFYEEREPVRKF